MIISFKDTQGFIYAYAEYNIVDEETRLTDNGKYVQVAHIWVHPRYRHRGVLSELILGMFKNSRKAEYVYWHTEKSGKVTRPYPITKLLRFTKLREVIKWEEIRQQKLRSQPVNRTNSSSKVLENKNLIG